MQFLVRSRIGLQSWIDEATLGYGPGPETILAQASENLTAGNFVNLYNNAGILAVRKADATDDTKPADGFVLETVLSGNNVTVHLIGAINTGLSGLVLGSYYYLSTTPGAVTATPPAGIGNIVQRLGKAKSTSALIFENQDYSDIVVVTSGVSRGFVIAMASAL